VPPDGLEEVYRLHERARGGLAHLPVTQHDHTHPKSKPRTARTRRRPSRAREASG
jgi:hypothetical protein